MGGRSSSITEKAESRPHSARRQDGSKPRRSKEDKRKGAAESDAADAKPRSGGPKLAADVVVDAPGSRNMSATSSTTGADADDDLSPAMSPALGATSNVPYSSGGEVSDMLEARPQGPSVLRITESTQPAKPPRPQQPKTLQPTETKKQRQNRRRAEEQKAARAEAEVERRKLLEKQLRTAREAEGRPARNGLGTSSTPAGASVWNVPREGSKNVATQGTPVGPAEQHPLLDTFNPEQTTESRPNGSAHGTAAVKNWQGTLPSEEEQIRMLNELDDSSGWNTVAKGKKGRKNKAGPDGRTTGPESSESEGRLASSVSSTGLSDMAAGTSSRPLNEPFTPPAPAGSRSAATPTVVMDASLNGRGSYRHPADSDWAVL